MHQFIRKTFPRPNARMYCSIVGDTGTKQAIIVDPGRNPEPILREIDALGLTVIAIWHTHAYFDYFLASGHIQQATGVPLYFHPKDRNFWEILEIQCRMFISVPYLPVPPPDRWIGDGSEVVVGPYMGNVIHTPGRTPGSTCFLLKAKAKDWCSPVTPSFEEVSVEWICGVEIARLFVDRFANDCPLSKEDAPYNSWTWA
jgi:glyoxylase-like metal-dependent hydrolase (beta-lactamase superfamily II)